MSIFSNPVIMCGLIALGIILILIVAVVICCKKSSDNEREELKLISDEISEYEDVSVIEEDDNIENVLLKMQEALEVKEETACSFEQEQEENAIISYQELLSSFGGDNALNLDAIDLYEDELENQIEISDCNKEIIEAYQDESLDREIYRFQNDYCNQPLQVEITDNDVNPFMNFSVNEDNTDFIEENASENVLDLKNSVVSDNTYKKFKRTEIISPVYGIISDTVKNDVCDDVEEIIFEENDNSLLDEF